MNLDYMGTTRGGTPWEPEFITKIDELSCIGCGRCYKVCPRKVFDLVERESEEDEDTYYGYDGDVVMVMTLSGAEDCIGCGSCSRVCPKNCHTLTPATQL